MNIFNIFQREGLGNGKQTAEEAIAPSKSGNFTDNAVPVNMPNQALSIAAFKRAVVIRANTMSQLMMQYQKLDKKGGNYIEDTRGEEARRINYLLQVRPNPLMSAPVFFRQAMIDVDLNGNAIIYIDRDEFSGAIKNLWLCNSAGYDIIEDSYYINYYVPGGTKVKTVKSYEVIHLRGTLSNDKGLTGISLLDFSNNVLSLAATNDKLVLENAAKGGKVKLLVQEEKAQGLGLGRASKKELQKITKELNDDIYSADVVLMSNVAGVTPISQNMQQQEVQMSRAFSVREIARITGVPPILLMDDSNSSYKSPEAATQEFLLRTIAPIIREWEAEFNSKMLGPEGYGVHRFHLCEKPLLRLDPVGTANVAKVQLETGVKSVNELRAEQDMPTIEGGDKVLVSTNLQEVNNMKVNATSSAPPAQEGGEQ